MTAFQDTEKVLQYEYRCRNASLATPLFRRLISAPLAQWFPLWLAPNVVTLAANVLVVGSCLFTMLYAIQGTSSSEHSALWLLLPAVGILGYAALDNADGLHAKRTGSSGPLGDFFDHWLDGIAAFMIPIALASLVGLNVIWQAAIVTGAILAFWTTAWERMHTGWMRLPILGDVEANLAATGFLVLCAVSGLGWWQHALLGLSLAEWFGSAVVAGALAAVGQAFWRGRCRWQIGGIVVNLGLVWISMLLGHGKGGANSFAQSLGPWLIGLIGLKHVGDLMRSHLIGTIYNPFDLTLTGCGIVLCATKAIPSEPLPQGFALVMDVGVVLVVVAKLGVQFFSTTTFICRRLGVRFFRIDHGRAVTSEQSKDDLGGQSVTAAASGQRNAKQNNERVRTYRLVHVSVLIMIVAGLEIVLWMWGRFKFEHRQYQPWGEAVWALVISVLTIIICYQIPSLLFGFRPKIRKFVNVGLTIAFLVLLGAQLFLEHPLDFYFLGDNFAEIFYPPSIAMATKGLALEQTLIGVNAVLAFALLLITTKVFENWPQPQHRGRSLLVSGLVLALLLVTPLYRHNELSYFLRTAVDYSLGRYAYPGIPTVEKYPYVHRADADASATKVGPRPNIFLILMESFNDNFVEKTTDDGRAYTPVFNERLKEGVFVERFYGNSIQTARAYMPTLSSILPSYWGKEATDLPNLRVRSLAHILKEQGYRTLFFQSQQSLEFDQIGEYMKRLGFEEVRSMNDQFISPDEAKNVWGWGLQDDKTFQKVFQYLDGPQESAALPVFVVIMTTSHHYPFKEMPSEQRYLYQEPKDRKEWFANSIHLADKYLGTFFAELGARDRFKDSLVVITGDHSFPAGEHGNYFNEYRFYEENFRIPLLLWWPGKLPPQRITDRVFSQIDIAPTVLDLLAINTNHHFLGRSVLSNSNPCQPIAMVQPYDGTHLCIVNYPFKYVKSLRVPGEYLFNLKEDPGESNNVIEDYRDSELLEQFSQEIARVHLNQRLIETNRIWPPISEESLAR